MKDGEKDGVKDGRLNGELATAEVLATPDSGHGSRTSLMASSMSRRDSLWLVMRTSSSVGVAADGGQKSSVTGVQGWETLSMRSRQSWRDVAETALLGTGNADWGLRSRDPADQ